MGTQDCSVSGCNRETVARGWCHLHYYRWKRNGDPLRVLVIYPTKDENWGTSTPTSVIEQRLNSRSQWDGKCLRWLGSHATGGYGLIAVRVDGEKITRRVHQVAYELWVGAIPNGKQIDHQFSAGCRWRDCLNPDHLRVVTPSENCSARRLAARRSENLTHIHGDELTRYVFVGSKVCGRCTDLRKQSEAA